ncbi:MAG: GntR family transcriptional regulator [Microcella sp.]|uniref:GntR family transcriptional regulator n=1 Tax=Microcella sp. TaxID=1913979 RepID=UPI0033164310
MSQTFIREAIIQGVFRPGERLNLDVIASTLGVSRMPVRASLRQLEGEGLLTIHAHRGASVTVLGAKEIAEVYELRIVLESFLLEKALARLDDEGLATLKGVLDDLSASDESPSRLDRRRDFYGVLYSYAESPRAVTIVDNLRASVGHYLLLQRVADTPVHEELFEFVRARDLDGARTWLAKHLRRVSEKLQELVGRESEPQTA